LPHRSLVNLAIDSHSARGYLGKTFPGYHGSTSLCRNHTPRRGVLRARADRHGDPALEDPAEPASLRIIALNPAARAASESRPPHSSPEVLRSACPPTSASDRARTIHPAVHRHGFPDSTDCVGSCSRHHRTAQAAAAARTNRRSLPQDLRGEHRRDLHLQRAHRTFVDANPRFTTLLGLGGASQLLGKKIDAFGFWIDGDSGHVSDYPALLARLRMEHSIREVALTFRTFGGQVRRALVSLELFEVEDAEYILGIFWRV